MKPPTRALAMLALAALLRGAARRARDRARPTTSTTRRLTIVDRARHRRARGSAPASTPGGGGPANRVGALMTWTGFAWLLNAFVAANSPAIFTLAVLASNLYLAAFVHLLLAYPDGRLRRRRHRAARRRRPTRWRVIGPLPILMSGLDARLRRLPGLRDPGHGEHDARDDRRRR